MHVVSAGKTVALFGQPGIPLSAEVDSPLKVVSMDGEVRHLGLDQHITRRDFLNGVALGVGGSLASSWLTACGRSVETAALFAPDRPAYYPPALTGMRGSHDGSWELAHALRDGTFWQQTGTVTDTRETYDLVMVGRSAGSPPRTSASEQATMRASAPRQAR